MSERRAKTSGWAAFDLNERLKQQDLEPEPDRETFPLLSLPASSFGGPSQSIAKNRGAILEKPFSSLLLPSVSSPFLMANKGSDANQIQVGNSHFNQSDGFMQEGDFLEVCERLKELHPWADDTLITDVMAGVNDFNRALTLLEAMVSPEHAYVEHHNRKTMGFDLDEFLTPEDADTPCIQKFKEVHTDNKGVKSSNKDSLTNISKFAANKGVSLTDNVDLDDLSHALAKCLQSNNQELINNCVSSLPASSFGGPSQSIAKNRGAILEKPFSSLLLPSVSSPSLMANKGSDANQIQVGDSHFNQSDGFMQERDILEVCERLKELHPWADDTLITDVMAGVNDFNRALTLLEAMVSPEHAYVEHHNRKTMGFDLDEFLTPEDADTPCIQKFKEVHTDNKGVKSSNKDSLTNISKFAANKGVSLTDNVDLDDLSHALAKCLQSNNQELINNCVSSLPASSFGGPSQSIAKNRGAILEKPFSSLLLPSVSSPSLMANKGSDANQIQVGDSHFNQSDGFMQERDILEVCERLKELHPWADDTLITDVMAGVNDFNRALTLLEAMVSPEHAYVEHHNRKTMGFDLDEFLTPEDADTPCIQKFKEVYTDTKGVKSSNKDSLTNISKFAANKDVSLTDNVDLDDLSHALAKCLQSNNQELINNCVSSLPASSFGGPSQSIAKNRGAILEKPFSSLLLPSVSSPSLMANKGSDANQIQVGDSHFNQSDGFMQERDFLEVCERLKELHPWADDTLITDVMAGVNDFNRALTLLEAMVSPEHAYVEHHNRKTMGFDLDEFLTPEDADTPCIQKFKEVYTDNKGVKSSNKDSLANISKFAANKDVSLTDNVDLDDLSHALAKCHQSNNQELINFFFSHENELHYDGAVRSLRFIPVEPEWEKDDVYLIHRKDAVQTTRSAAGHSKAAREAYLRGDHLAAQHFSLKAREEWVAANRLHAQAAKEILAAHNSKNDRWTLDLHGLHAKEAVQALQEHLQKIESQVTQNLAAHMNQVNLKHRFGASVSVESSGLIDVENESKGSPFNKQRSAFLEVITGRGIHSRGQPALPMAIRSFLVENGYHYEETRPGVITVRPKFRP